MSPRKVNKNPERAKKIIITDFLDQLFKHSCDCSTSGTVWKGHVLIDFLGSPVGACFGPEVWTLEQESRSRRKEKKSPAVWYVTKLLQSLVTLAESNKIRSRMKVTSIIF